MSGMVTNMVSWSPLICSQRMGVWGGGVLLQYMGDGDDDTTQALAPVSCHQRRRLSLRQKTKSNEDTGTKFKSTNCFGASALLLCVIQICALT